MDHVYVGNLPPGIRIKDIDDFFRPFGKLLYIDVNHHANPVYACVQFDSARNAFMAVKSRHGYNYGGYTLQLRLFENEVRNRRESTPPPPPPPMFIDYDDQNNRSGFSKNFNSRVEQNYPNSSAPYSSQSNQWSNSRSNIPQYPSNNNRMNIGQRSMLDYQKNNRSNISYSSNGHPNMSQQYSNSSRSIMSLENINYPDNTQRNIMNCPNKTQQNMMNYPNNTQQNMNCPNNTQQSMMNYPNNTQQNMMNFPNTNKSNINYPNNNSWGGNKDIVVVPNNGGGNDLVYNSNNGPYAASGFEENYTRGLSGSGRRWFNRYIRKGFSPQMARAKALEHRTVPYLRDDPKIKAVLNNQTNAALENIGTTLMSLLSNNTVDNFSNGNQIMPSYSDLGYDNYRAGRNFEMPGSSSNIRGREENTARRQERNPISRREYLRSINILKIINRRSPRNAKDRLLKKFHTQIVNDYENYQKASDDGHSKQDANMSSQDKSYTELLVAFKKRKQQLLVSGRQKGVDLSKRQSGAFRKRMRILITEADFPEIEARALAVHPIEKLRVLMSMKADYEAALKKKQEVFAINKRAANMKYISYRNDISYLKMYEKQNLEKLSNRIKTAIRSCLVRVHDYERKKRLPLTKSRFTCLLSDKPDQKSNNEDKSSDNKRIALKKDQKDEKSANMTNLTNERTTDGSNTDEYGTENHNVKLD